MKLPTIKSKKIQFILIGVLVILIAVTVVLQQLLRLQDNDEPIIKAGQSFKQTLSASEVDYTFDDPLKTPASVPVYPISAAPQTLFSEEGVVSIAANVGFTDRASTQQATDGYVYIESGKTLSFNIIGGTISYSIPKEIYPISESTSISLSDAIIKAKDFVTKIGFTNPLYAWSEDTVKLYTLDGDTITDASFIDTRTHFHIPITMKIGNAPLFLQQEQYINVHANGEIIGAFLWYPHIDFSKVEQVKVIDYVDATSAIRIGRASYIIGKLDSETKLAASTIGYVVPKTFMQAANQGGFITEPVYVFSNDDVSIYVEALKE